MKLTDEVMNDLLTLYLAGEASADTRALVESHARQNAAFRSTIDGGALPPTGLPQGARQVIRIGDVDETRRFILLRTIFWRARSSRCCIWSSDSTMVASSFSCLGATTGWCGRSGASPQRPGRHAT